MPWVAALATMLVLAGLGLWLLLDEAEPKARPTTATDPAVSDQPRRDTRTPEGRATLSAAPVSEPTNLARFASVQAPPAAPPNHDLDGNQVRYDATNMVDGALDTCWRMPGDGTGESIALSFDAPTELHEVGLVNGYAKVATDGQGVLDWYAGNRRITSVEWTFDDGTTVVQRLGKSREVQSVTLDDPVVTRRLTVRLLDVTPPGPGRASRNYTAISEVALFGVPQG